MTLQLLDTRPGFKIVLEVSVRRQEKQKNREEGGRTSGRRWAVADSEESGYRRGYPEESVHHDRTSVRRHGVNEEAGRGRRHERRRARTGSEGQVPDVQFEADNHP